MRIRFVLLAAGLAAAALLVAILVRHRHSAHIPAPRLLALAPAQIERIDAQARGWPRLALEREVAGWVVRAPVSAPADASRVAALIAALREPVARKYPAGEFEAGNTGLGSPALKLAVNGESLEFGIVNPATLLRYVRRGGEVVLAMDYVTPMLQGGPWQFVDPHLLPPGAKLEKIQLPGRALNRKGGSWRLAPAAVSADAAALAAAWRDARANSVVPLERTPAAATRAIRVSLAGRKTPIVFVPVAEDSGSGLARPDIGIVYRLDSSAVRTLLASPAPGTTNARTPGS